MKAHRFFAAHETFVLTTHEGADADGIGAEILLWKILTALGKRVRVINSSETAGRFEFIDPDKIIEHFDAKSHRQAVEGAVLVILDNADKNNLGIVSDELVPFASELFAIDHHETPIRNSVSGYIDSRSSSTCEMVVKLAESLSCPIDIVAARAAYAGIMYDTGSFIYPKTSAETFKTALKLIERGVVPNEIYQLMYESGSTGALLLQKRVLSSLEMFCGERIAFQLLLKSDLELTGVGYDEAESLINLPLRSKTIEVSIMLKESLEGKLRGSLRSKGLVNVSVIAQSFGGGGHRTAAGFKCEKGLAETKKEVLHKVTAALEAASIGCP